MSATTFDDSERTIWAGRAGAYADTFARLCAHAVPDLLDAAEVGPGVRLLDVGTGPGTVAAAAYARGATVTAVDAEPSMVELARAAVPAADCRVAVLPDLPFGDGEFDAVVGNFVLNHVGQPRSAVAELRRVVRPGGWVALTIWPTPPAPGQSLIGRAIQAAGARRPPHLPPLQAEEDFARTAEGLTSLLAAAGLREVSCETLHWNHRVGAEEWWAGPAAGVAFTGQLIQSQPPAVRADIKAFFDEFSAEFADTDGLLTLPHAALLARARS
ncbi:Methyltransferase domain-containing protein [Actinopolymorpha cephalotaxi]|uniref:Methyltransferase domain-containing protein n=1 Tax=Actinopolymorpha cephalotaxi TaxID=504797 RepID=A0A1I2N3Z8_9ACTN|nr:class I SAM-dependent methyltransferase [Actinopolymorpha cephalotaxi]NYH85688.1 SAM-dependent methyltransferase [Actinopolymorpha cephalotaxi]SFF98645.1 Methyltransferase domain-containing protein [Actinopolymorpha cephalotaxi]